jgi:hypothetical protein
MSWIERLLLGKDAAAVAEKAAARLAQSEYEWEEERRNFHAMRGRLLSTVESARPVSETESSNVGKR